MGPDPNPLPQPPSSVPTSVRPADRARVLFLANLHFQPPNDQPVSFPSGLERTVRCKDADTYTRKLTLGEEWKPLDAGHLTEADPDGVGLVTVRNDEGRFPHAVPSPEERAALAERVVEVGVYVDNQDGTPGAIAFARVAPGEALPPFDPAAFRDLRVRCRKGTARVTIHLLPR